MKNLEQIMNKFNSYSKGTQIWLWHEITLPKIRKNLQNLRRNYKWIKI